jgi:hypothetical protein
VTGSLYPAAATAVRIAQTASAPSALHVCDAFIWKHLISAFPDDDLPI